MSGPSAPRSIRKVARATGTNVNIGIVFICDTSANCGTLKGGYLEKSDVRNRNIGSQLGSGFNCPSSLTASQAQLSLSSEQ